MLVNLNEKELNQIRCALYDREEGLIKDYQRVSELIKKGELYREDQLNMIIQNYTEVIQLICSLKQYY